MKKDIRNKKKSKHRRRGVVPSLYDCVLDVVSIKTRDVINNKSWTDMTGKMMRYTNRGRETNVAIRVQNNLRRDILTKLIDDGNFIENILPEEFFGGGCYDELDLTNSTISDISFLVSILRNTPDNSIKKLKLNGIFSLNDAYVEHIVNRFPNIEVLYMEGCRVLTDKSIDIIISKAKHLKAIDIGGCYNITRDGIEKFIQTHPNSSNFTQLHLSGATPVADNIIRLIGLHCPCIQQLSIGYGKELSEETLLPVIKGLPHLTTLQLHWNHRFTDNLLESLKVVAPQLQELNIMGCQGFSDGGILKYVRDTSPLISQPTPDDSSSNYTTEGRNLKCIITKLTACTKHSLNQLKEEFDIELIN